MRDREMLAEDLQKAELALAIATGMVQRADCAAKMLEAVELLRGAIKTTAEVAETWRHMEAERAEELMREEEAMEAAEREENAWRAEWGREVA